MGNGVKLLYVRVSTEEQNEERQIKLAEQLGIDKDNIYIDKKSGKNTTDREQLKRLLDYCRKGDTVYTESISRIARNTKDLLNIVEQLNAKQVDFVSLKEKIDTSTPQGKFMLTVFGALAELERECILQRQAEGIAIAKEKGLYKGRQPIQYDKEKFTTMCKEWRQGKRTAVSIQQAFHITHTTFYRWVRENNL